MEKELTTIFITISIGIVGLLILIVRQITQIFRERRLRKERIDASNKKKLENHIPVFNNSRVQRNTEQTPERVNQSVMNNSSTTPVTKKTTNPFQEQMTSTPVIEEKTEIRQVEQKQDVSFNQSFEIPAPMLKSKISTFNEIDNKLNNYLQKIDNYYTPQAPKTRSFVNEEQVCHTTFKKKSNDDSIEEFDSYEDFPTNEVYEQTENDQEETFNQTPVLKSPDAHESFPVQETAVTESLPVLQENQAPQQIQIISVFDKILEDLDSQDSDFEQNREKVEESEDYTSEPEQEEEQEEEEKEEEKEEEEQEEEEQVVEKKSTKKKRAVEEKQKTKTSKQKTSTKSSKKHDKENQFQTPNKSTTYNKKEISSSSKSNSSRKSVSTITPSRTLRDRKSIRTPLRYMDEYN